LNSPSCKLFKSILPDDGELLLQLAIPSIDPLREALLPGEVTLPDSAGPSSNPQFGPAHQSGEGTSNQRQQARQTRLARSARTRTRSSMPALLTASTLRIID